jgi:hypothetical protein
MVLKRWQKNAMLSNDSKRPFFRCKRRWGEVLVTGDRHSDANTYSWGETPDCEGGVGEISQPTLHTPILTPHVRSINYR